MTRDVFLGHTINLHLIIPVRPCGLFHSGISTEADALRIKDVYAAPGSRLPGSKMLSVGGERDGGWSA